MITIGVTLLAVLIFAYIIPLTIAVDPENPLEWYYPCICGYRRKRIVQAEPEDDLEDPGNFLLMKGFSDIRGTTKEIEMGYRKTSPKEGEDVVDLAAEHGTG